MHAPPPDCPHCPRLCAFRADNRARFPTYHNDPVPAFGGLDAALLVVGLAPGLHGANQSGRPFTGDYAGLVLYQSLLTHGFARGDYAARADDGLVLSNCRITNAVRCVPPENKPTPQETSMCNGFLRDEIAAMPQLKAILTLGLIAHQAVLKAMGLPARAARFAHGARHSLPIPVFNSYHCSRYNINTGRLTQHMFDAVMADIRQEINPDGL